jgi:hypothetical protein
MNNLFSNARARSGTIWLSFFLCEVTWANSKFHMNNRVSWQIDMRPMWFQCCNLSMYIHSSVLMLRAMS